MKTLFLTLTLFVILSVIVKPQEYRVLIINTAADDQTDEQVLDLIKIGSFDSIGVSVYASGEIDIDTLVVYGGIKFDRLLYGGADVSVERYEALEANVLTINLADGVTTIIQNVTMLTAYALQGYSSLKFFLVAAAAGNDATDTDQKWLVYLEIYRTVHYNKSLN